MGRMQYWMNVSVDLRIEAAAGEDGGGSWMRIGTELHEEFNRRARALALSVEGRRTYEIMERFWPAMATDESAEPVMRDYGEIWTSAEKVLVSRTRESAGHNTRIVGNRGDDAIAELARIRRETDGTIGVGGATLATELLRAGLLDDLLLFQHPTLLGAGRPLFDEVDAPIELELLETEPMPGGVVLLRYEVARDR